MTMSVAEVAKRGSCVPRPAGIAAVALPVGPRCIPPYCAPFDHSALAIARA